LGAAGLTPSRLTAAGGRLSGWPRSNHYGILSWLPDSPAKLETMSAPSPRSREQGLRRLSRLTAWVAAGAIAATGLIAAAAADALPGRSSSSSGSTVQGGQSGSGDASTTTTVTPPDGSSDSSGLQPAAQVPVPTGRSHHVVSGGT
jgi:hypothetical protein